MRRPLLLMEPFNDWDLQAVVRSCSFPHPEPREPAGGGGGRGSAAQEAVPAPAPAPRGSEALERAAPACAAPTVAAAAARKPARASTTAVNKDAALLYELEYLDLDRKPPPSFLLSAAATSSRAPGADDVREVMISFPAAAAAAASTSGVQPIAAPHGRKPGARTPRPKRSKKSQLKKVVREMPVADGGVSSSDPWAWRKYGQKPIKGSPYPRGYYKCSSMKGCMARKLVERSPAKPGVLIVTYMAEHCHPVPRQLNALAGTTRHKSSSTAATDDHHHPDPAASSSPKSHEQEDPAADGNGVDEAAARCEVDGNETSSKAAMMGAECGGAEEAAAGDDDGEFWPAGMELDELLAPVDDDFDFDHVIIEEDSMLGRRLSL